RDRVKSYRPGAYFDSLSAPQQQAFERFVALANDRGITPVIVITTMHPDCIRICGPAGWNARRLEVRRWLVEVQRAHDFRLVDLSFPATWKGSGRHFLDEVHLRQSGANLVVDRLQQLRAFD